MNFVKRTTHGISRESPTQSAFIYWHQLVLVMTVREALLSIHGSLGSLRGRDRCSMPTLTLSPNYWFSIGDTLHRLVSSKLIWELAVLFGWRVVGTFRRWSLAGGNVSPEVSLANGLPCCEHCRHLALTTIFGAPPLYCPHHDGLEWPEAKRKINLCSLDCFCEVFQSWWQGIC